MPEQIALIEIPIYDTTRQPGPRVLHDLCKFEVLGTLCHVRTSADGDILDLTIGHRRFAVSVLDLAATAALEVEGHLKGEIKARIIASRAAPAPQPAPRPAPVVAVPLRGAVEADGFVTLHPKGH